MKRVLVALVVAALSAGSFAYAQTTATVDVPAESSESKYVRSKVVEKSKSVEGVGALTDKLVGILANYRNEKLDEIPAAIVERRSSTPKMTQLAAEASLEMQTIAVLQNQKLIEQNAAILAELKKLNAKAK